MTAPKPITIAILAMGGQGGGVLADWIVDLAERNGYLAQATSVPGVAQRTGATIYYVELFPEAAAQKAGRRPVLALMPAPGDVDVVLAAELMEAGRAIDRGLVTPDRTTLIASTHRDYAIGEKMALGSGILDHGKVLEAGAQAAKQFIRFDMAALADAQRSVISAVLFGALAASEALPFAAEAFKAAIERGGIGVKPSLRAFDAAFSRSLQEETAAEDAPADAAPALAPRDPRVAELKERVAVLPLSVRKNALEGVRRMLDYQDPGYAELYLQRLESLVELDHNDGGGPQGDYLLSQEGARYLALWMSYEDTIRIADLKTRSSRFQRFRNEVEAADDQIVYVSEFMHPRIEEVCDTLPPRLGSWLQNSGAPRRLLERICRRGRRVRTATVTGFSMLFLLARLRRWRRSTLRYVAEQARIEAWLERVRPLVARDYALAVEVICCQRLIKGYGDTFERGLRNFEAVMRAQERLGVGGTAAASVRRLREAALADDEGKALARALDELEQPSQPVAVAVEG